MADPGWVRVATLRSPDAFRRHLEAGGIPLAFDDALATPSDSPFARPLEADGLRAGNRFCVLPMEGWDGTADGHPTELTRRRWRNFGLSGAKLIWGGEAAAVRHDGRANPCQLVIGAATWESLARLRDDLVSAHESAFGKGAANDLVVGLQITHSGRYARPSAWDRPEPLVAFAHPVLDRRFPGGVRVLTDEDLDRLAEDYVRAAVLAQRAGLPVRGREALPRLPGPRAARGPRPARPLRRQPREPHALPAHHRRGHPRRGPGPAHRGALLGLRHRALAEGRVRPRRARAGRRGLHLGLRPPPRRAAWRTRSARAARFLRLLHGLGIRWACVSAGSPYYNPHVQRPALFPPSDGYLPPEDPLAGVARQVRATALLKKDFPDMVLVGSAYSYLQEWLPNVGQRVVREGQADFVGLGRMVLSYPEMPADVLAGRPLVRKKICRTFSDCTTAPRKGLPSGCYPLDPFYAARPEAERLKAVKEALRA